MKNFWLQTFLRLAGFPRRFRLKFRRARRALRPDVWIAACRMEPLEERVVLNAAPIAGNDVTYITALNTALTITTSNDLLDNDWDSEASTLTASVVANPANGSISNFSGSAGTLTYTPTTGFQGEDSFTYKVNDGTSDSNIATVKIAVVKYLGSRTNADELPSNETLLTGAL